MTRKTVLIAGASGLVGFAAMQRFAAEPETEVIAVSRRAPLETFGARWIEADLTDAAACRSLFGGMTDVTHLVFAALHERPGLMPGWLEQAQIATNDAMLRNLFEPLRAAAKGLRHVSLLQGTKAYGAHVHQIDVPARPNRSEDRATPNFYWVQEDYLRGLQAGTDWRLAILRPQIVFGISLGAAMNLIPVLGAYAALEKARGKKALAFPGGPPLVLEACDADLLADAILWAGEPLAPYAQRRARSSVRRGAAAPPVAQGAPTAKQKAARAKALHEARAAEEAHRSAGVKIYNVTNGDVFVWHHVWPAICEAFGMDPGSHEPQSIAAWATTRAAEWDEIRAQHDLAAPGLAAFAGESFHYADFCFATGLPEARGLPPIVSTVNLRQDGFTRVIDTEAMFVKHIRAFQERRLLPRP